jgi:hypothetical protein
MIDTSTGWGTAFRGNRMLRYSGNPYRKVRIFTLFLLYLPEKFPVSRAPRRQTSKSCGGKLVLIIRVSLTKVAPKRAWEAKQQAEAEGGLGEKA